MKWKKILLTIAVATFLADAARAAETADRFKYQKEGDRYGTQEFQVDLFGSYATKDRFGESRDRWGGGLGLTYFFSKYVGIGADSWLEEWKWPYRVNGDVYLRLPIEKLGLAPYAYGGGGREFKYVPTWTAHAGGGIEFRLNRYTGLFADGRRIWALDERPGANDFYQARFGLRLVF